LTGCVLGKQTGWLLSHSLAKLDVIAGRDAEFHTEETGITGELDKATSAAETVPELNCVTLAENNSIREGASIAAVIPLASESNQGGNSNS
jgi:hypothetical protein